MWTEKNKAAKGRGKKTAKIVGLGIVWMRLLEDESAASNVVGDGSEYKGNVFFFFFVNWRKQNRKGREKKTAKDRKSGEASNVSWKMKALQPQ